MQKLPERTPAGCLLILRDGDPGTPEVTLSRLQYHYEHRADVEMIIQGKTPAARDADFDALLAELARIKTRATAVASRSKTGRGQVSAPIFILVSQVEFRKRLDLARDAEKVA